MDSARLHDDDTYVPYTRIPRPPTVSEDSIEVAPTGSMTSFHNRVASPDSNEAVQGKKVADMDHGSPFWSDDGIDELGLWAIGHHQKGLLRHSKSSVRGHVHVNFAELHRKIAKIADRAGPSGHRLAL